LTVAQAADALNISQDAVRKRIARGTIPHDRDGAGRVYVYLSLSETVHKTDQDARVDEASKTVQDRYVRSLEDQIAFLRRELERKDAILLNLSNKIPELEPPESPQTVEEEPERAETGRTAGEVQESAASPQLRGRWRAPVDKLPWWHYVLGLLLVSTATFVSFFAWQTLAMFGLNVIGNVVANVVLVWFPPAVFGFWVGLRRVNPRFKSQVIPFGLLVGLAVSIGRVGQLIAVGNDYFRGGSDISYWAGFLIGPALPGWLFYVSGVLIGTARQRRRTRRLSSTISSSPEPTTGWTPRQQAILGFAGTVIAALISLMGTIGSAIMASGG
jgi:hypothetical protein